MDTAVIKIADREWKIKWTLRALLLWQKSHDGQPFNIRSLEDHLTFLYCIFVASNDQEVPDVCDLVPVNLFIDEISQSDEMMQAFDRILKDVAKKKSFQMIAERQKTVE